eukprot:Rmarinus@m.25770
MNRCPLCPCALTREDVLGYVQSTNINSLCPNEECRHSAALHEKEGSYRGFPFSSYQAPSPSRDDFGWAGVSPPPTGGLYESDVKRPGPHPSADDPPYLDNSRLNRYNNASTAFRNDIRADTPQNRDWSEWFAPDSQKADDQAWAAASTTANVLGDSFLYPDAVDTAYQQNRHSHMRFQSPKPAAITPPQSSLGLSSSHMHGPSQTQVVSQAPVPPTDNKRHPFSSPPLQHPFSTQSSQMSSKLTHHGVHTTHKHPQPSVSGPGNPPLQKVSSRHDFPIEHQHQHLSHAANDAGTQKGVSSLLSMGIRPLLDAHTSNADLEALLAQFRITSAAERSPAISSHPPSFPYLPQKVHSQQQASQLYGAQYPGSGSVKGNSISAADVDTNHSLDAHDRPVHAPASRSRKKRNRVELFHNWHNRMLFVAAHLLGRIVEVQCTNGHRYAGYFHAACTKFRTFGVVIRQAWLLNQTTQDGGQASAAQNSPLASGSKPPTGFPMTRNLGFGSAVSRWNLPGAYGSGSSSTQSSSSSTPSYPRSPTSPSPATALAAEQLRGSALTRPAISIDADCTEQNRGSAVPKSPDGLLQPPSPHSPARSPPRSYPDSRPLIIGEDGSMKPFSGGLSPYDLGRSPTEATSSAKAAPDSLPLQLLSQGSGFVPQGPGLSDDVQSNCPSEGSSPSGRKKVSLQIQIDDDIPTQANAPDDNALLTPESHLDDSYTSPTPRPYDPVIDGPPMGVAVYPWLIIHPNAIVTVEGRNVELPL